jgi:ankyrin repeat protein
MYASYIGHDLVVSRLLEGGACVNNKNNKGRTPLCLAASCGNNNVSELLLRVSTLVVLHLSEAVLLYEFSFQYYILI